MTVNPYILKVTALKRGARVSTRVCRPEVRARKSCYTSLAVCKDGATVYVLAGCTNEIIFLSLIDFAARGVFKYSHIYTCRDIGDRKVSQGVMAYKKNI